MNDTFFNNTPPESGQSFEQSSGQGIPVIDSVFTAAEEPPRRRRTGGTPAEVRRLFSRLGLAMLVLTLGRIAGQILLEMILLKVAPSYATEWWGMWLLSLVPLYGVGLPLMLVVLRKVPTAPHNTDCEWNYATMEKPRFTAKHWVVLLFIAFGCMQFGSVIGNRIMAMLQLLTGYPYTNSLNTIVSESPVWATLIGTCICAPIGEEYIFRKLLIDRTRRYGDTVSIVISGFFFGLFHGNLFQFFYAFFFGMVVAYVYTRSGKLKLCIAMHAVVNFMGGVVTSELAALLPTDVDAVYTPLQNMASIFLLLWMGGTMIAGSILLLVNWKRRKLSLGETPLFWKNSAFYVLLNPGMLLNFVAMSFEMAWALLPAY